MSKYKEFSKNFWIRSTPRSKAWKNHKNFLVSWDEPHVSVGDLLGQERAVGIKCRRNKFAQGGKRSASTGRKSKHGP